MNILDEKWLEELTGCIRKQELAKMYFKDLDDRAALNAMSRAIREDAALLEELEEKGNYNKYKHSFMPLQVRIIAKHMGPP